MEDLYILRMEFGRYCCVKSADLEAFTLNVAALRIPLTLFGIVTPAVLSCEKGARNPSQYLPPMIAGNLLDPSQ